MRVPTAREYFFSPPPSDAQVRENRDRAFFHAIRLRTGANKTTYARRLDGVNAAVARWLPPSRPLEMMDVGVSSGITTLEWMDDLDRAGIQYRMTAADVCLTAVVLPIATWMHVLLDANRYPLQFEICGRAVPYPPGKWRSLLFPPLSLLTHTARWVLRRVPSDWLRDKGTPVLLIDPRLKERSVEIVEEDMFTACPSSRRFDVIRAANVLNRSYFSDSLLTTMAVNLRRRLRCGGLLIVCRTDEEGVNQGSVFASNETSSLDVVCRIGSGSEVEELVLRAAP